MYHYLPCSTGNPRLADRAGLDDAPQTLQEEFTKIKSDDVILPARYISRYFGSG